MTKRICIFSLTYVPFIGGAEIAVKELTGRMPELAFDMVTLRFNAALPVVEKIGNVTVHRIGFAKKGATIADTFRLPLALNKYLFPFIAVRAALRLHRERPFDAIWSIQANYAGFAALFFKQKYPDVPFILNLQEGDPLEHYRRRVGMLYPLYKKIFRMADRVHAISTYLADFARRMGARSVEVIPNGVDTAFFTKDIPVHDMLELRKHLGLAINDEVMVTTSRLVEKNAVDDCIRALPDLPVTVKFLILGTGPDEKSLRKLAAEIGVADRVIFLGHIPYEVVPYYLKIARVFVRPSLSEGMGNSFIEAMAAGVPVVATPVGGITDFVIDPSSNVGKVTPTGLFARVRDPRSVAEKVKVLLLDTDLREKIIANAQTLAGEKYDWARVTDLMRRKIFTPIFSTHPQ